MEHYEIAAYGTVIAFAEALGEDRAVAILQKTLTEEQTANDKLTGIAEGEVNQAAVAAGEQEEDKK